MNALKTPVTAGEAVSVKGLHKAYNDFVAVRDVTFSVYSGEVFGLLGPNGAGKTTTIETVVGLRQPTAGNIRVLGYDPQRERDHMLRRIGVQPQEASLFPALTVEETLTLFASFHKHARNVGDTLTQVGLESKRKALIRDLSGGQRQRVLVAVALIADPEIIFLDEPTSGLDPQARRQLWALIEEQRASGRTVVLTTHYMDEAERLCDRVGIIDHGAIVALDSPSALIEQNIPHRRIGFEVAGRIDLEPLGRLPGATEVTERQTALHHRVTVTTDSVEMTLPALTTFFSDLSVAWTGLQVESGTLEDVFIRLTGRPIREEG